MVCCALDYSHMLPGHALALAGMQAGLTFASVASQLAKLAGSAPYVGFFRAEMSHQNNDDARF